MRVVEVALATENFERKERTMAIKKISYAEMERKMFQFNERNPQREEEAVLSAVIVFKPENWDVPYSELSRSYRVCNNNRAFQPGKIACSVYGYCLDGTDPGVRLDWYKWKVDYCYMEEEGAAQ